MLTLAIVLIKQCKKHALFTLLNWRLPTCVNVANFYFFIKIYFFFAEGVWYNKNKRLPKRQFKEIGAQTLYAQRVRSAFQ